MNYRRRALGSWGTYVYYVVPYPASICAHKADNFTNLCQYKFSLSLSLSLSLDYFVSSFLFFFVSLKPFLVMMLHVAARVIYFLHTSRTYTMTFIIQDLNTRETRVPNSIFMEQH